MSRRNRRSTAAARPTLPPPIVVDAKPKKPMNLGTRVIDTSAIYDGDDEFISAARPSTIAFDPTADVDHLGRPFEVVAKLYEVSSDGKSYRLKRYSNKAELREALSKGPKLNGVEIEPPHRLREAKAESTSIDAIAEEVFADRLRALRESDDFDTGAYDYSGSQNQSFAKTQYGDGVDIQAEYIPMMAGPSSKQLYESQYREMHSKAFEAYNHNPVAHQLCELQTAFCLGRGVDHQSTNQEVDAVWREFVERTDFYNDLENIATDLWWSGEMVMEFYDSTPSKGYTDYRMVDPSTILEYVTDPEDIQKMYFAYQQYSTPYQNYTNATGKKIDAVRYVIRQIPAADFIQVKLNVSKYEKRGRSDLFSVLGWVKRLKDLMNARVIKGQLEASFVWDVEVMSGDADVQAMSLKLPDPYKAGSTFVHNSNVQLKPQSSQIRANESQPDVVALLNLIAVGFGIPKEFIGEASKGAKAGALAATEPGTKRFEKRQRLIERICHQVADRVIKNALDAGRLKMSDIIGDARSVSKLGDDQDDVPTRDDVAQDMQDAQDAADQKAEKIQNDQLAMNAEAHKTNQKMAVADQKHQHMMQLGDQKNQHRQALAIAKNTSHKISTTNTNTSGPDGSIAATQSKTTSGTRTQESLRTIGSGSGSAREADAPDSLNDKQKERVKVLKESMMLSKEFFEFIFPAIAQEDRSAKLKDLALSEAMQWLPKSMAATLAAKELSITTYSFEDAWRTIVDESNRGMSIAHVYAQDNEHVPETTIAQDVQAEQTAKQPVASQQFQNVPIPPPVAGDKLVPAGGGAPGGPPGQSGSGPQKPTPGNAAQSGSTKVNHYSGPANVDPTAGSHGYSSAANNPMTAEGKAKARESIRLVEGGPGSGNHGHAGVPGVRGGSAPSDSAKAAPSEPGVPTSGPAPWDFKAPAEPRYAGDTSIYSPAIPDANGKFVLGRRIQGFKLEPDEQKQVALYTFIPKSASPHDLAEMETLIRGNSDHAQLHPGQLCYNTPDGLQKVEGNHYWIRGNVADMEKLAPQLVEATQGKFGKDNLTQFMTNVAPNGTPVAGGRPVEHVRIVVPFAAGTPANTVGTPSISEEGRDTLLKALSGSEGRKVWEHADFNGMHLATSTDPEKVAAIYDAVKGLGGQKDSHEIEHHSSVGATRFIPKDINIERYPVKSMTEASTGTLLARKLVREALGGAIRTRKALMESIADNERKLDELEGTA